MKAICYICNKEFERKPALLKRAKNPTCSKECRNKMYMQERIIKKCVICGKEMQMLENRLKHRKNNVCSQECKSKLLSKLKHKDKIQIKCPVCNKYFEIYPYRLKQKPTICCSKECSFKLQCETQHPRYNPNISDNERINKRKEKEMSIWRNKVFDRDNYTCNICKQYGGKLEAHHLNGYNWDKENRYNIDNGITLCKKCHKDFHNKYGRGNNTKEQYLEYANQSGS